MKPSVILGFVVGIVLMVGGMWLYQNNIPDLHALAEQGVPLNLGKTIATIGVLLILFPVVAIFFVNPLNEAIHERTTHLENTFSEAESLRTEMTKMKSDYERRLSDTEAQARAQIQEQIREAQQMRQQLMADAQAKAEEYRKKAQEEIDAERDRVVNDLRVQTVNLSLAAAEKVIGENLDTDRNRKLIEEFISNVEVPA